MHRKREKMDIKDKVELLFEEAELIPKWEIVDDFRDFILNVYKLDISYKVAEKYLEKQY
jgi:hypothetical protein